MMAGGRVQQRKLSHGQVFFPFSPYSRYFVFMLNHMCGVSLSFCGVLALVVPPLHHADDDHRQHVVAQRSTPEHGCKLDIELFDEVPSES